MSDDTDPARPSGQAAAPKRRRRYPWILAGLLLALAGLVAAAPGLISTPWARQAALDWYNANIPGDVEVGELSLSWLDGQSVNDLVIRDPEGDTVLTLKEFATELSLLEALQRSLPLGRTVIRGLDADLRLTDDGTSNLARALGSDTAAPGETGGGPVVPITGNMELADSRIAIAAPGIEPVVLDELAGTMEMPGPDAPIALSFSGRSRQGDLEGSITLDGRVTGLFTDGKPTPAAATMNVNARLREVPVDAVDQLLGAGGLLTAALGNRTSLTVEASGDASRQNIALDATAPNAEVALRGMVADGRFSLTQPAGGRLQVTPALVEAAAGDSEPAFRLAGPTPLDLEIERLDVPLAPFALSDIAVQAKAEMQEPVRLAEVREIGEVAVSGLRLRVDSLALRDSVSLSLAGTPSTGGRTGALTVDAEIRGLFDEAGRLQADRMTVTGSSRVTGVPTALLDTLARQDGLLVSALGPELNLELEAEAGEQGEISAGLKLDSERLKTGTLAFTVGEYLTLTRPTRVNLTLSPSLWGALLGEGSGYRLAASAPVILDLTNLRLPLPGGSVPALHPVKTQLQATLSAKSLSLEDDAGLATRLDNLVLDVGGRSLDAMDLDAAGELVQTGGLLERLQASPLRVDLKATAGLDETLAMKPVESTLILDSAGLKTNLSARIDQGFSRLTLTAPASVNAVIMPALLPASGDGQGPAASLERPANVEAKINTLTLPLSPFEYRGASLQGDARIATLLVRSPGAATTIEETALTFGFEGADGRASLEANARVRPDGGESGDLSLSLDAGGLVDQAGALNTASPSLNLEGSLEHLPVVLVDQLLGMDGLAVATLGATADFDIGAKLEKMRGPVTVSLASGNTRADVKARIQDSGLTLTEPLTARVQPTPEFGSKVLAKVHPIFETLQRSEEPIRFTMPDDGVLIPVDNYDFSRVVIPEMSMDFGKLVLESGWLLRGVIGLSQQFGKLDSVQKEEWEAWFTPGVMEVRDGRVLYKRRLDLLLARKLHLATWGGADVSADRSDLVLAFMPDTMERVFSITVSGDDALHIPIGGPLSSPSIDYKQAVADLARLRAREEVSGENSLAGALLGAVTGKSAGGGAPPASVDPLPWAEELAAQDAAAKQQRDAAAAQPAPAAGQDGATQQQAEPHKAPSTEEQVIRGLIDIFGKNKKGE